VTILNEMSMLQMREFMLDSECINYNPGDIVFRRNDPGSSLFAIAEGSLLVEVSQTNPDITVPIEQGSIIGEVGLISGRRRGATVRAAEPAILIEIPRNAALKLMATVPAAKRAITRISTERMLLQMFGSGLTSEDLVEVLETVEIKQLSAGDSIIKEGEEGYDIFVIRQGSMVVEKNIGGKPVFLSYLPAGSYVGEMALIDGGRRTATVRAAIKSEVIRLDGHAFRRLLERKPELAAKAKKEMSSRQALTSFIEAKKDSFGGVVDMYSSVASFLLENGIGEATDVLLIDENLCVGCDNCEKACADSHEGLSRSTGRPAAPLPICTCRHRAGIASIRIAWPIARPTPSIGVRTARCSSTTPASAVAIASATALWRDPPRQGAAQETGVAGMAARRHRAGPGRAAEEVDGQKGVAGNAEKGDQVRHVFRHCRRAGMRARLPDRRGHSRGTGRVSDGRKAGQRGISGSRLGEGRLSIGVQGAD
jgi:CRP-like cAMP-binding protein